MSCSVISVIPLLQALIRCASVTPEDAGAQVFLAAELEKLGFTCHHLKFGDVPNLFARRGTGSPHICFAGHTDVVPPGPEERWTFGPFNPEIKDGVLYGRGASDMKGAVAAFAAAVAAYLDKNPDHNGSISFLITGDEEGPAVDGTVRVLGWMKENGHVPDMCLVGEPTNPTLLGQEVKIGRRGSLTGVLTIRGRQGHVAYPHLADNPVPRLVKMLSALAARRFDEGNDHFQPTNLEITTVDTGNRADNVIPDSVTAVFNVRFNDSWTGKTLAQDIEGMLKDAGGAYEIEWKFGAESFLTQPGAWPETVKKAAEEITGRIPAYTTNGGTSDARFIVHYCPVVEFGGINKTVHQIDENASVADLEGLVRVYVRILEKILG
ncbi:MAG: succinyl-diaminopimelate desuccinylase [Alphaproteobacteria bacterium]|nr:succinyl-diaminopimelate desuccinylase [Alphaproteobacteria bacterium]